MELPFRIGVAWTVPVVAAVLIAANAAAEENPTWTLDVPVRINNVVPGVKILVACFVTLEGRRTGNAAAAVPLVNGAYTGTIRVIGTAGNVYTPREIEMLARPEMGARTPLGYRCNLFGRRDAGVSASGVHLTANYPDTGYRSAPNSELITDVSGTYP